MENLAQMHRTVLAASVVGPNFRCQYFVTVYYVLPESKDIPFGFMHQVNKTVTFIVKIVTFIGLEY